jgi:predicted nucleic acid-binding protein
MSNVVVVDTSIVFKWVIDESDSNTALALLTEWISRGLEIRAPALIVYEVTNALHQRVRRGELSLAEGEKALAKVESSEIVFYFSQGSTLSSRALVLANYYNLPANI